MTQGAASDPDRHTAELAAEQAYVDVLYARLDDMRRYAADRLQSVLLDSGGTPQARSERESFNQLYTEDLQKYDAADNGLAFGRIDVHPTGDDGVIDEQAPTEARYIGRIGILDEEGEFEPLLLDWRAPLARPFYLATPAVPDGVTRRRHLRSRSRTLIDFHDEYLDLQAAIADGVLDTASHGSGAHGTDGVAGESALLAALNEARTGHMQDIVETIQSQQDAIIRSEHRGVLVVQGGPGTGKTAVALHRAAYLLYTYRQQLDKAGVLIIGPNSTFLDYIGQVLPSLGETGVLLSTIGDLYPGVVATVTDPPETAALKGDLAMTEVCKLAIRDWQTVPDEPIEIHFDTYRLQLDRKLATRARGRARSSRRPHNLARPVFVNAVVDALTEQFSQAVGTSLIDQGALLSHGDLADIRGELREDESVMAAIDELWPELTPQRVLAALWNDPDRIEVATPDLTESQRALLVRPLPEPNEDGVVVPAFSAADAPMLDEIAELLGEDDSAARRREQEQWRREIEDAQDALDILTGSANYETDEDYIRDALGSEMLNAYDIIDAEQLAERQHARTRLTAAERAAGDRTWTYGHVIVDEAQELSPMAWRMLMRRIPNHWMTLVGDIAQTGTLAGADAWSDVLTPYVANRWKLAELTVNYRTPSEIMRIAHDVLAEIDPEQELPRSVRDAGSEPWAATVDDAELSGAVAALTRTLPDEGTMVVLVPAARRGALEPFAGERVSVLTVEDAKGLEFDFVLMADPAAILAESARGLNDLYVGITRATQRLGVLAVGELPEVLSGLKQVPASDVPGFGPEGAR